MEPEIMALLDDDIKYTRQQADYLATIGITVKPELIDPNVFEEEPPINRASDQWANLWNLHPEGDGFMIPYEFNTNTNIENYVLNEDYRNDIREWLQDFERDTCLRFFEVEGDAFTLHTTWPWRIQISQGSNILLNYSVR